jgi:hypothetical protein
MFPFWEAAAAALNEKIDKKVLKDSQPNILREGPQKEEVSQNVLRTKGSIIFLIIYLNNCG